MRSHPLAPLVAALLTLAAALPAAAQISPAVERWSAVSPEGGTVTALAVAPGSSRTLYAGTESGLVFRSTDGGTSWAVTGQLLDPAFAPPPTPVTALAVDPRDPAVVYAATCYSLIEPPFSYGGVFKSTNGGRTWSETENGLSECLVMDVALDPRAPDTVFAATQSGLYESDDSGASWDYNGGPGAYATAVKADPSTPGTLYVLDFDFGLRKSTDGGATWASRNNGLPSAFRLVGLELDPLDPGTLYVSALPHAAGGVAPLYRSTDGGDTWAAAADGLGGRWVRDLAAGPSQTGAAALYAATADGVYRSLDGGLSWSAPPAQTLRNVLAVAAPASSPGTVLAGARDLGVFRSTDSGTVWRTANRGLTGLQVDRFAVAPSNPSVLYAVVSGLSVQRSDDGGATWRSARGGLPVDPHLVVVDPRNPAVAFATHDAAIWKTTDRGASWRSVAGPAAAALRPRAVVVDPRDSRNVYAVGVDLGYPAPAACHGLRSSNGGETWSCMPDLAGGHSALVIDGAAPARLYAGAFDGVRATADGGLDWNDVSQGLPNPPQLTSLALSSYAPGTVFAGTWQGLFRRSGNGLWAASPAPFLVVGELAVAPSDPTVLYARAAPAGSPYRLFRSVNVGSSWQAVTQTGLPGGLVHGVAVHPSRPRELFVMTRAGLYRLSQTVQ